MTFKDTNISVNSKTCISHKWWRQVSVSGNSPQLIELCFNLRKKRLTPPKTKLSDEIVTIPDCNHSSIHWCIKCNKIGRFHFKAQGNVYLWGMGVDLFFFFFFGCFFHGCCCSCCFCRCLFVQRGGGRGRGLIISFYFNLFTYLGDDCFIFLANCMNLKSIDRLHSG